MAKHQVDKAFQHTAHLAKIERGGIDGERIVLPNQRIQTQGIQRLFDGQIKRHLHLFITLAKLIEGDLRARQRGSQHAVEPCGQHRRPLFLEAAQLEFFRHPVGRNRLGKIEIFEQTVQKRPRRRAARELVRRKLRLLHDLTDAGGIDVQSRQKVLRRAVSILLQAGVTGDPPVIGHRPLEHTG